MPLKGEVELYSHGNYFVDHGKSWKNHGIVFLNFFGNPETGTLVHNEDPDEMLHHNSKFLNATP